VLEHKAALFDHLRCRWQDLFGARFEVLLYDLTSTIAIYRAADEMGYPFGQIVQLCIPTGQRKGEVAALR